MTPYIGFHPGGLKYIMMGAGRDATTLFNKFHSWVNMDFLMAKCMVGLLESPSDRVVASRTGAHAYTKASAPATAVPIVEASPPAVVAAADMTTVADVSMKAAVGEGLGSGAAAKDSASVAGTLALAEEQSKSLCNAEAGVI